MEFAKEKHAILLGAVTFAASYQLGSVFRGVGYARQKYNVSPPETDGPEEFKRIFRAQTNCAEFFPLYLGSMWTSGIFFHPVPAAAVGALYIAARDRYVKRYASNAQDRLPSFMVCVHCIESFFLMSALGVGHHLLLQYVGVDLKTAIVDFFKNLVGK